MSPSKKVLLASVSPLALIAGSYVLDSPSDNRTRESEKDYGYTPTR